jgi:hypothetical protein
MLHPSAPQGEPTPDGPWTAVNATDAQGSSLSPSLFPVVDATPAFELKFPLTEVQAEQVEYWAREHLAFDPHADAAFANAYRIHSLYLDTVARDVFHRTPGYRRRKFRLRRYGSERGLYLERKTRDGDRVRKRRTLIPDTELGRLHEPAADPHWGGHWFHSRLLTRGLLPACHISYDRVAHVGTSADGPLRLTLDRDVRGTPMPEWQVGEVTATLPLFPGQVLLELKYRAALPALFKGLIAEFNLSPRPASKYRCCVEAWGRGGQAKGAG